MLNPQDLLPEKCTLRHTHTAKSLQGQGAKVVLDAPGQRSAAEMSVSLWFPKSADCFTD